MMLLYYKIKYALKIKSRNKYALFKNTDLNSSVSVKCKHTYIKNNKFEM